MERKKYIEVFIVIIIAFFFLTFVETAIEGPNGGGKATYGFTIHFSNTIYLRQYHLFLFYLMIPAFLALPLIITGFDLTLLSIELLGYSIGSIIEDTSWFIFNPYFGLSKFNPQDYTWFPWLDIFGLKIPILQFSHTIISIATLFFIWKGIPYLAQKGKIDKSKVIFFRPK